MISEAAMGGSVAELENEKFSPSASQLQLWTLIQNHPLPHKTGISTGHIWMIPTIQQLLKKQCPSYDTHQLFYKVSHTDEHLQTYHLSDDDCLSSTGNSFCDSIKNFRQDVSSDNMTVNFSLLSCHIPCIFVTALLCLIPKLDEPIPARSCNFGCFMWVPQHADADVIVGLELGVEFGASPVPDVDLAVCVPTRDVAVRIQRNVTIETVKINSQNKFNTQMSKQKCYNKNSQSKCNNRNSQSRNVTTEIVKEEIYTKFIGLGLSRITLTAHKHLHQ